MPSSTDDADGDIIPHMASSMSVVESGRPVFDDGVATLGPLSIPCDGTIAGQVWGAGAALGRHLLLRMDLQSQRPDVVEIGSGTGIAGLAAAVAGARRVVLTDLAEAVPRLAAAIARNEAAVAGAECSAAALEWGDADAAAAAAGDEGVDLVLAADVLYSAEPSVHEALRATLVSLAQPRDATILHCFEERWPQIIAQWREGVEASGLLRLESEEVLEAPPSIRDGRRLILQTMRLTEEGLFS